MKRPIHIFALLLFAMTQLVAPFAHAHVDGIQSTPSLHVSDIPHHLPFPGLSQCHVESHESQIISAQQEYQRDDAAVIPAIPVSAVRPLASSGTIHVSNEYDSLRSTAFAYHRPHPQAPPA